MDKSNTLATFKVNEGTYVNNMFIDGEEFEPLCTYIPKIGDEIFHIQFGKGIIELVEGCPAGVIVNVRFDRRPVRLFYGATIIFTKKSNKL